jgi:hypothetical protein
MDGPDPCFRSWRARRADPVGFHVHRCVWPRRFQLVAPRTLTACGSYSRFNSERACWHPSCLGQLIDKPPMRDVAPPHSHARYIEGLSDPQGLKAVKCPCPGLKAATKCPFQHSWCFWAKASAPIKIRPAIVNPSAIFFAMAAPLHHRSRRPRGQDDAPIAAAVNALPPLACRYYTQARGSPPCACPQFGPSEQHVRF